MTKPKDAGLEKILEKYRKHKNLHMNPDFVQFQKRDFRNALNEARDYGGVRRNITGVRYTSTTKPNFIPFGTELCRETELIITYENGDKEKIDLEPTFNFNQAPSLWQRFKEKLRWKNHK